MTLSLWFPVFICTGSAGICQGGGQKSDQDITTFPIDDDHDVVRPKQLQVACWVQRNLQDEQSHKETITEYYMFGGMSCPAQSVESICRRSFAARSSSL